MFVCAPAVIYLAFSLTQIIIDTFKGLYNLALTKCVVMIIITYLLNALCENGMSTISWIIVFIPFIFMSVIVTILLIIFGLDPESGKLMINNNINKGGNLIFTTGVQETPQPVQPQSSSSIDNSNTYPPTSYSSDSAYESFENII
jgi:hypothetical protein